MIMISVGSSKVMFTVTGLIVQYLAEIYPVLRKYDHYAKVLGVKLWSLVQLGGGAKTPSSVSNGSPEMSYRGLTTEP